MKYASSDTLHNGGAGCSRMQQLTYLFSHPANTKYVDSHILHTQNTYILTPYTPEGLARTALHVFDFSVDRLLLRKCRALLRTFMVIVRKLRALL